ncbi:hypothetical protein O181_014557 [Austropuccinia psidii MF-1]|uniref:C2H2-type domain-containing protein n=1 Tax=Austropuccinia psidii MF-1 TaxID=1389203 RepID=A0A9Q3C1V6_9BASI|nr:hypothetical protein [Austropuccinia psidii MF-1]
MGRRTSGCQSPILKCPIAIRKISSRPSGLPSVSVSRDTDRRKGRRVLNSSDSPLRPCNVSPIEVEKSLRQLALAWWVECLASLRDLLIGLQMNYLASSESFVANCAHQDSSSVQANPLSSSSGLRRAPNQSHNLSPAPADSSLPLDHISALLSAGDSSWLSPEIPIEWNSTVVDHTNSSDIPSASALPPSEPFCTFSQSFRSSFGPNPIAHFNGSAELVSSINQILYSPPNPGDYTSSSPVFSSSSYPSSPLPLFASGACALGAPLLSYIDDSLKHPSHFVYPAHQVPQLPQVTQWNFSNLSGPICSTSTTSLNYNPSTNVTASPQNKAYHCSVCGRTFPRQAALTQHQITHTSERPHPCPVPGCPKAFTTASNARRHAKIHYRFSNNSHNPHKTC